MRPLPRGTVISDDIHKVSYQLKSKLGQGGFGTAYRAVALGKNNVARKGSETCIKLSLNADAWHGEVYFARLLRGVGHVVDMHSAFPTTVPQSGRSRTAFAINMEFVPGGTVRDECERGDAAWTEEQVCRRVRLLLKPLELLHNMGASHRDVTPANVFVGNKKVLKLGDFGITKAQLTPSGVRADLAAWPFAPRDIGAWWRPADDVYQVGLLMATLVSGWVHYNDTKVTNINEITAPGQLRDAIKAAIRVKAKRPKTASELAALLS